MAKLQKRNSELEIEKEQIQLKLQEKTDELKGKAQGDPTHIHPFTSPFIQEIGTGWELSFRLDQEALA